MSRDHWPGIYNQRITSERPTLSANIKADLWFSDWRNRINDTLKLPGIADGVISGVCVKINRLWFLCKVYNPPRHGWYLVSDISTTLTASVRDLFVLYNTLMFPKTIERQIEWICSSSPLQERPLFWFRTFASFAKLATFSPKLETLEFFFPPVLLKTLLVSKRELREMLKAQKSFEFDILMSITTVLQYVTPALHTTSNFNRYWSISIAK